ncbi:PD-(D/E)XK nuclease-like domain-containing protein [Chitinophaga sp. sic0106]|uniref:PD-(D/E)XK nuclease-like domain-containing protein n=1 Tax=Chitinophaga sp. sic0106 TaxID=2854785 RepID=UPI001C4767FF|nr:PD-(D/E)XK nuclease-like domain-containing protein [Chitinophaga sp. sic0106]MBV7531319.1 PD-(D/E)XK nuclease-like domain-containing protein [Chitinophaga sp. sic0106]
MGYFDQLPDLDNAVADKELNPLGYSPGDYPSLHDMLNSHQFNSDQVTSIDLVALSVNGIVKRDSMEEYHRSKHISSTALKEALKTPFHYKFYQEQRALEHKNGTQKPKKHFQLGTFVHEAFLEPEIFDKTIIAPDYPMNTTDGVINSIRWYEKVNKADNANLDNMKMPALKDYLQQLIAECPYTTVDATTQFIIDCLSFGYKQYGGGIIARILKGAVSEVSFYGVDEETGLKVRVRPDFFNIEENIGVNAIISVKTTSAQTLNKFVYDAAKYQYELSEGMYLEVPTHITGRKFNVVMMIMLQTVPPYMLAVYWWRPDDLQNGKYKYRHSLNTVKECTDKLSWPGYDSCAEAGNYGIIEMQLPEWSQKELHPVDIDD